MSVPTEKPAGAVLANKPMGPGELAKIGAGSPPPAVAKKRAWTWLHVGAAAIVVVALVLPTYLAIESATVRAAGVGGFVALFCAMLSVLVALVRVVTMRKHPRALGLAALSASLGGAALLVAALGAELARSSAEAMVTSDVVQEPGMREYLVAEADGGARTAALLGLAGVPGFAAGLLLLAYVLGARRIAPAEASAGPALKTSRVWLALVGSVAAFLLGVVSDVIAIAHPVREATHPHAAKLDEVAAAKARGDMAAACDGLEIALAPDYAPETLFEAHLPGRLELAHRCVTYRIDALPKGTCAAGAKELAKTETVKLAKAEDRVAQACEAK